MQVKEHLQALSDESKIRVEKIGSGNWYWSFLSEEKKDRQKMLGKLGEEKEKIDVTIDELQARLYQAAGKRDDGEDGREGLLTQHAQLMEELLVLKDKLNEFRDGDPEELVKKKSEIKRYEEKTGQWVDNLDLLESWLDRVLGGDKGKLERIKRSIYGDEYAEGEDFE